MAINISSSVLLAYLQARDGGTSTNTATTLAAKKLAAISPVAPWLSTTKSAATTTSTSVNSLVESILGGTALIDPSAAKLSVTPPNAKAATDYQNLFALYKGLTSLQTIATAASGSDVSATQLLLMEKAFASGLTQARSFINSGAFQEFQVSNGTTVASETSTTGALQESDTYTTQPLVKGSANTVVPAFQGDVAFALTATNVQGQATAVQFNLADMGSTPRTLSNVTSYMNSKLKAAGLVTRMSDALISGTPSSTTTSSSGVVSTTLATPDQFALQINGTPGEQLSFSAATTAPAVYIAQTSSDPAATTSTATTSTSTSTASSAATSSISTSTATTAPALTSQLLKLDTPGSSGAATSRGFSLSLPSGATITSTATAPDGSVYVLANVTSTLNGQPIQGRQDAALIKYDSAGNLVYTRTLGSSATVSASALSVSADGGQVAIAGSETGAALDPTDTSQANSTVKQSFVTVFNSGGDELWSKNQAAAQDNQVNAVAFGANNSVYVTGTTAGRLPGASSAGSQDGYLQGFSVKATTDKYTRETTYAATTSFTTQFGTSGVDRATGVAVDGGSIYTSSVENGEAVVRRYDLSGTGAGAPTLGALQDLGTLKGGDVSGLAIASDGSVLVAGSTHNGALAGTVTSAYSGNGDAFVADLSSGLTPNTVAYYNAGGPTTASAVTLSGGDAYIAGQIAGATRTSIAQGYAAAINPLNGSVDWSTRFSGDNGSAIPSAIAVSGTGASVLDRLGLPQGPLLQQRTGSQTVVANSSARAGDSFYVQNGTNTATKITIAADDTYTTLARKISQASGFNATVTTLILNGQQEIRIAPANSTAQIRLEAGPGGQDALAALGLKEGLISTIATAAVSTATTVATANGAVAATNVKNHYGITVGAALSLGTTADAKAAAAALGVAIAEIKSIYSDLTTVKTVSTGAATGTVPAYITARNANYALALKRLQGG